MFPKDVRASVPYRSTRQEQQALLHPHPKRPEPSQPRPRPTGRHQGNFPAVPHLLRAINEFKFCPYKYCKTCDRTSCPKSICTYSTFGRLSTSTAVNTSVGTAPSSRCEPTGNFNVRSSTTRTGERPAQCRTVSDGLSNNAVRVPTIIAGHFGTKPGEPFGESRLKTKAPKAQKHLPSGYP